MAATARTPKAIGNAKTHGSGFDGAWRSRLWMGAPRQHGIVGSDTGSKRGFETGGARSSTTSGIPGPRHRILLTGPTRVTPTIQNQTRRWRWPGGEERRWYSSVPTDAEAPSITTRISDLDASRSIATITISNPRKLNIVNTTLLEDLTTHFQNLSSYATLRAAILTGGPTAPDKAASFIGGMDMREMSRLSSPSAAKDLILTIHAACSAIRDLPVPVLAKIDGYCLGAGLEVAASCDLRMATRRSVFGMPEVRMGIPSVVEAALLPGLVGMGRARRMVLLAEQIDAGTAERWGLVEEVVETSEELEGMVGEWVGGIAGMGGMAMRSQKRLCRVWEERGVEAGIRAGVEAFGEAFEGGAGEEARRLMGEFVGRKR